MWKNQLKFRFLEGIEVAKREVCNDIDEGVIESVNGDVEEKVEGSGEQEKNGRRVSPPSQPAVVSVLCLRSSLFLVQVKVQYHLSQSDMRECCSVFKVRMFLFPSFVQTLFNHPSSTFVQSLPMSRSSVLPE